MPKSIAEREQDILGSPPRILPMDRHEAADSVRAATARIRGAIVGDSTPLPLDAIPEIMFTLCRWPDLWDRYMALALQTQGPGAMMRPRDREIAILRTAWLLQAPFEWGEHVPKARKVGVTAQEIEDIITGPTASGWSPFDRALVSAADELRADAMVSDAVWDALGEQMDDGQRFELLVLVGQFTTTAYFQNSLRLRLEPGNAGLATR